jgi:hypothetical protein
MHAYNHSYVESIGEKIVFQSQTQAKMKDPIQKNN